MLAVTVLETTLLPQIAEEACHQHLTRFLVEQNEAIVKHELGKVLITYSEVSRDQQLRGRYPIKVLSDRYETHIKK
jgi:hypothetical protein